MTSLAELDTFLDSEEANYGLTDQARQLVILPFCLLWKWLGSSPHTYFTSTCFYESIRLTADLSDYGG
jgi:hypothetical protein